MDIHMDIMRKLMIDTDPGIDDALALTIAAAGQVLGKVELLAVTTVAGNTTISNTTRNALRVIEHLGLDVPVYRGSSKPLARDLVTAEHYHGSDGLAGINLREPRSGEGRDPAPAAMARILESEKAAMLAIGPLTNIAMATILYPWLPERVEELVIMGGAYGLTEYGRGNATPLSEFNFYVDPEAAELVLSSGYKVRLVGLDVTQDPRVAIDGGDLKPGGGAGSRLLEMLASKLELPIYVHDAIAAAEAIGEGLLSYVTGDVVVARCEGPARGASALIPGQGARVAQGYRIDPLDAKGRILDMIRSI